MSPTFNVYLALGFGAAFGGAIVWGLVRERRRRQAKRQRFTGRRVLEPAEIYDTWYAGSGLARQAVLEIWAEAARLLGLDAGRLRPGDRFDRELAPLAGEELSDEIEDLSEWAESELAERGVPCEPSALETLDDLVRVLAENDNRGR